VTHYIAAAVFLSQLAPGTHTVSVGGIIGGEPVEFVTHTLTVTR
jgi:hypothetical protein